MQKLLPQHEGYTMGQLLVATPQIQMSCFHKAVIFMATHGPEGAMGFIVNQPLQRMNLSEILEHFAMEKEEGFIDMPVHFGGPVDSGRGYVLHSSDYATSGTTQVSETLSMSTSVDVLKDLARGAGPEKKLLLLGYAGWGAGQLEQEIEANSWFSVPATDKLIFGSGITNDKWLSSAKSQGIDPYRISDVVGHA